MSEEHKSMESSVHFDESTDRKSIIYTHTMSVYSDTMLEDSRECFVDDVEGVGRVDMWLAAAELFTELSKYQDAADCIQEARNISPLSAGIFYLVLTSNISFVNAANQEGLIEEMQQKDQEAVQLYEKALSIDSHHRDTLLHLGKLCLKQQQLLLAEKYLSTLVQYHITSHQAW